ncbi:DUF2721 domain-containing protein [Aestuariibacter sp. GS-14]|uniref:DUF2721 domain-containing protein n=1 Tax=Alteromonadaceae TaxID=72275 RepID=UPI00112C2C46|nr:DUF2721 domain-containing protein [Aestuariibacter sp. GS-14]TPV58969.1 DUF2721 domain-containing protein [Aestuariibacter sp. GS-14]
METLIPSLSTLIEIAVAPVFLLAGIAGFLNVMSGRLGRITDRVRAAEKDIVKLTAEQESSRLKTEIILLWRRVRLINWAIGFCTASAFMVCSVIMSLFAGELWQIKLNLLVITLFILAMLLLICALLLFLLEVKLATATIRVIRTIR